MIVRLLEPSYIVKDWKVEGQFVKDKKCMDDC